MIKRLSVALAAFFVLATQSFAAGTIPYSLSQQFDKFGHVLAGCKLNIIVAGTVGSPQIAYQDTALTIPVPGGSQLVCDAAGRLPQFFLADGNIKIQLTDANGVLQVTADNILVIGNSSGGGGGSPVDPTTILATGDLKATYGTGVLSGFVRANGRTIGSATSGATERANSDTQALFQYLWGADPNLVVLSGRGASANADWVANKQLTLPDWRDKAIAGLGDMGNSDAGLLTATYFGVTSAGACVATTLGCWGGAESQTLAVGQLPQNINSGGSNNISVVSANGINVPTNNSSLTAYFLGATGASGNQGISSGGNWTSTSTFTGANSINVTSNNTSGLPHPIVSPVMLTTIYLKL